MKTVCVSGYFNPIHRGHIDYLREAAELGDNLIVILNNDEQVKLKGNIPFMDLSERFQILKAIKYVDMVIASIDLDETVCKTLELIKPDIFAKGGDRINTNTPELELCNKLGIKVFFGVGGGKVQSSSELLNRLRQ